MTKKLNLTPLIKHFSATSPAVAQRLLGLTKEGQRGTGVQPPISLQKKHDLKKKVDKIKDNIEKLEERLDQETSSEKKEKLKQTLKKEKQDLTETKTKIKEANEYFRLKKLANTLVEIGNELDLTNPTLASETDALLQEVVKQAQMLDSQKMMGCSDKCMDGHHDHSPTVMMIEPMHGGHMLHDPELDESDPESTVEDPMIEEISEPEPEYDMVSLDDIKSELENMKWRIADKKRREALASAIEHIEKAMDYHNASKTRRDKVHSIFDEAGLSLRLKDFE